ncbi:MAG TPA: glycerol-3-phosphate 1-O-acyltransferase PlsY [Macromonas sp.]|nr:glycerol-3-phosphate 1-O-acyltransferase PlsY [Macromonas sp.]
MNSVMPLAVVAAYLIGSLSFAVVVSKLMGLSDPRTYGSKNPGATNVLRSGSKLAAVLTLLLDGVKGWLPVWAVNQWGGQWDLGEGTLALVGLAAFLGHLYPVFFRFQGGKGVATAAGVLLGYEPWLGLAVVLSWVLVAVFFRYSSLAAIVAAVFAPLYYLFGDGLAWNAASPVAVSIFVMCLLLLWRHGANIQRLITGQESKIGGKSK